MRFLALLEIGAEDRSGAWGCASGEKAGFWGGTSGLFGSTTSSGSLAKSVKWRRCTSEATLSGLKGGISSSNIWSLGTIGGRGHGPVVGSFLRAVRSKERESFSSSGSGSGSTTFTAKVMDSPKNFSKAFVMGSSRLCSIASLAKRFGAAKRAKPFVTCNGFTSFNQARCW